MINSRKQYNKIIDYEFKVYFSSLKDYFKNMLLNSSDYSIWKFQKLLRKTELFYNLSRKKNKYYPLYILIRRKKEKIGHRLGLSIEINVFQEGLRIFHYGEIVVNGYCEIGKNCKLHGGNCIGNNGKTHHAPRIGDNCDVGFGSVIIGDITLGDNITIGANSLVNKSFNNNIVIAGSPAKVIKYD